MADPNGPGTVPVACRARDGSQRGSDDDQPRTLRGRGWLRRVGQIADSIELRRDLDVRLTGREREVLAVAAEGLTARQIATRLGVRERTVTTHLGRIYGKLGVGNRLSAIRMAARSGMVSVGSPE
ncbi:MAG: helix-turn-helix transcriptional regulator [Actinobacteria bacterium]|nr:MAG: helix-turn-helix transcriptional regulator [Actinomycetota bacterium]